MINAEANCSVYRVQLEAMQSDLTEALELLVDAQDRYQHGTLGWYDIQAFLSRHSATAAKDGE